MNKIIENFKISFYNKNFWMYVKSIGNSYFKLDIKTHPIELKFKLNILRNFEINNYFFIDFDDWKTISIKLSSNNVQLLSLKTDIIGLHQEFYIGSNVENIATNVKTRRKKYKEFYWSKFVKIYNNNFLHNSYGRTIEFNLPCKHYLKIGFNHQDYYECKNETKLEFTINLNKDGCWCSKDNFIRLKLCAFHHYLKIVLGKNHICRYSVLHSVKSLEQFRGAKINKALLNYLFLNQIKPHETWIFKKVIALGIDLSKLYFSNLIYHLAFKPNYHKTSLDYILSVAKENCIRFFINEKNNTNAEIIQQLQEYSPDFEESVLNQLIKYVETQEETKI